MTTEISLVSYENSDTGICVYHKFDGDDFVLLGENSNGLQTVLDYPADGVSMVGMHSVSSRYKILLEYWIGPKVKFVFAEEALVRAVNGIELATAVRKFLH